jgi:hypothetical protein
VAGVPKDSIRQFLNHSGGDINDHYIRHSALGELQLAQQEAISAPGQGAWAFWTPFERYEGFIR